MPPMSGNRRGEDALLQSQKAGASRRLPPLKRAHPLLEGDEEGVVGGEVGGGAKKGGTRWGDRHKSPRRRQL